MADDNFSAETIIQSISSDISSITAADVVTIVEKANDAGKAIEMGDYLTERRPDLEDDIEDAVGNALARF